ncbi:MAG: acyl carrier protein, partial [Cyanobacteria bacterium P01_F01_bin.86]
LGIDSLKGIELIEALSQKFEIEISPASLFEYPTIAQLSEYLSTLHQFEASFQPEDQQRSPETESTQGNWVEVEL